MSEVSPALIESSIASARIRILHLKRVYRPGLRFVPPKAAVQVYGEQPGIRLMKGKAPPIPGLLNRLDTQTVILITVVAPHRLAPS